MTNIQVSAEYLSNLCLESAQEYHEYTNDDLLNSTLIFSHFLMDMIWRENQHLTHEKRAELAETTGKMIRELIKVSCGLDMHEVAKKI